MALEGSLRDFDLFSLFNMIKIQGKNGMPSSPTFSRTIFSTYSQQISATDCRRSGTSAR